MPLVRRRQCKLTDNNVRYILRLLSTGQYSQRQIAEMFGVSKGVISDINVGRTWKHIDRNLSVSVSPDLLSNLLKLQFQVEVTFEQQLDNSVRVFNVRLIDYVLPV